MTEGLTHGIPAEAREALSKLSLPGVPELPAQREERISLKDAPYVDTLERWPELGPTIASAMDRLKQAGIEVPLLHITSRAVRHADGSELSTGYLESIDQHGFRARDTNVAALMERGPDAHIADPEYFAHNPHKFLRAVAESLAHYGHHGSRTNKQTLGEQRESGIGLPVIIAIDATGVPLVPGTDYDDHFLLGQEVPSSRIMGVIDLEGRKPINPDDVAAVTEDLSKTIEKYADNIGPQDSSTPSA